MNVELLAGVGLGVTLLVLTAAVLEWSRVRLVVFRSMLTLTLACVGLIALDLGMRSAPVMVPHPSAHLALVEPWPPLPLLSRYRPAGDYEQMSYGDLASHVANPDLREQRRERFHVDELGFRNTPGANGRPIDTLVVGDSHGLGQGTTQDRTWVSLLETRYGRRPFNLSVGGFGPWHELVNLQVELQRIRVRPGSVVVWQLFSGDDLDEQFGGISGVAELPWSDPLGEHRLRLENFRVSSPLGQYIDRLGASRPAIEGDAIFGKQFLDGSTVLFRGLHYARGRRTTEDIRAHHNAERLRAVFDEMRAVCAAHQLALRIAVMPSKEDVYRWLVEARPPWSSEEAPSPFAMVVAEMAGRDGVRVLDLQPVLVRESAMAFVKQRGLVYWRDDSHLNEAGHEIVADAVHRALLRETVADTGSRHSTVAQPIQYRGATPSGDADVRSLDVRFQGQSATITRR